MPSRVEVSKQASANEYSAVSSVKETERWM